MQNKLRSCLIILQIGLYINELLKQDEQLKELDLDCEYNKNMSKSKLTPSLKKGTRPDLIIHRRNKVKNNFIIELKGWWNKETLRDIKKLEEFTTLDKYNYKLGVFVVLTKNFENLKLRFFKNVQEIIENDLSITRLYKI